MNYSLIKVARDVLNKVAFVPSGDPSMGGAPPGGAPPMDPSMMGGAPPMDPSMMGGAPPMDPSMMGGAPPMDPSMMGGAPPAPPAPPAPSPMDPGMIQQIVADEVRKAMGAGGAGAASGGGGGLKPKIDVNVELMQIKHMLAKLADALNVKIPAQDLVATPEKLMAMANGGNSNGGGDSGGGAISAIKGITGITPAGTPGGEKAGRDMQSGAQTVRDMFISPTIKQAEAAGQAMTLPLFQANDRATRVAAAVRGRR